MRFKTTVPAILAEFIGTYALVFFGCGAIILSELENLSSAVIPIIFGLTITIFVYLLGRFSGAHFNPAVTIGFLLNKEISIKDSVFYIGIQILGGMLASLNKWRYKRYLILYNCTNHGEYGFYKIISNQIKE